MRSYLALAFLLVACKPSSEKENPSAQASSGAAPVDPASLGAFSEVTSEGTADLDITVGPAQTVSVACGDGKPTSRVMLSVAGTMLTVKTPRNESPRCKVTATIPALTAVASTGTGGFTIHGKTALARITSDGTGAVTADAIETDALNVIATGTGAFTLAGKVTTATFKLQGTGTLGAKDLVAETVTLVLEGTGAATVNATKKADVSLGGVGSATVYGNPAEKVQKKNGLGTITFK